MDLACHFVFSCGRDMGWEMIWEKTGIHKSFTINSSHATPLEDTFCPNLMMITMPLENILVQNSGKKGMLPLYFIEVCQFYLAYFGLLTLNIFWKCSQIRQPSWQAGIAGLKKDSTVRCPPLLLTIPDMTVLYVYCALLSCWLCADRCSEQGKLMGTNEAPF